MQKTILLRLPKGKAHRLAVKSRRRDMDPEELAGRFSPTGSERKHTR
ncbi:MAG: hypothetical protein KGI27_14890 [Thaumarchaeota archaeon]|nr:hypothetical protein [Nitrososphaerota archaeon]